MRFQFAKIRYLTLITLMLYGLTCSSQTSTASVSIDGFTKLLDQKDYFNLETHFNRDSNYLTKDQRLYYHAFLDNAFNRNDQCIHAVSDLLNNYSSVLPPDLQSKLLLMRADSYFKNYEYANAAIDDSLLMARFSSVLDSSMLNDIHNDWSMRNDLRNIPPQQTSIQADAAIQWKKDHMGLMEIPVTFNNHEYQCVFDTKANISCITDSYAADLGLHILPGSYDVGAGITGITFKTRLGVADSIYIGNILIKNTVFLVMPDAKLRFFPYAIHVIIGFPIIAQLGELQMYKDGRMIIPVVSSPAQSHNLALNGATPVLSLQSGNDTLNFDFDLGAAVTILYSNYFNHYKDTIVATGKNRTSRFGGAGGSAKKDVYQIPQLDLSSGGKTVSLHKINVLTAKTMQDEKYYGNLGQDFTKQFEGFIMNFKDMFFKAW